MAVFEFALNTIIRVIHDTETVQFQQFMILVIVFFKINTTLLTRISIILYVNKNALKYSISKKNKMVQRIYLIKGS